MLHLISQSPLEMAVLDRIDTDDCVVFLENAVLRLLQNGIFGEQLNRLLPGNRFFVLSDDLSVRGIAASDLFKGIEVIDFEGLVELTVRHRWIQTWS